ncbi:hypothetical protein KPL35_16295 [Clostridium sp. CF011]|uniref:hypothetical protein n=1 Tax=Clostridium sp. CF011 TaxID=2843318 RepID=UPI001C0BA428|nr:hypothetical protein [Clostridium sp. CF011]MBU3093618.1 hypothetical protein [Clostridium sp. CF011]WAG70758.1 hypothetical protein LL036_04815 [Clostridium sp. CF011]
MKRIPYIILLGCIIVTNLISACGKKNMKNNLIIGNKSSEIISDIVIQRVDEVNIIASHLKANQHGYFDMGVQENCTYKVEFEDKNNKSTRSKEFTSNFSRDQIANINILKDNNGEWSVIIEN